MPVNRRDFLATGAAAAGVLSMAGRSWALPGGANRSFYKGVQLGVQTYSFHDIPNDGAGHAEAIIRDMRAVGAYDCELFGGPVTPGTLTGTRPDPALCPAPLKGCGPGHGGSLRNPWGWEFQRQTGEALAQARERQRKFLIETPASYYADFRARFDRAGINIHAYNPLIPAAREDAHAVDGTPLSDEEIEGIFRACQALRVTWLNLSTRFATIRQMAPFAEKYRIMLCPHGHSNVADRGEFSDTKSFEAAFALSEWVGANLDIGHFHALGEDPRDFIGKHHKRISNLHLKDRQRNQPGQGEESGMNMPWGQGSTPIRETLKFLQQNRYAVPAFVEYEYAGTHDPVSETRMQLALCRKMLD
ncbi:sugar phosphate isomerase/epimerase family protein [Novosphingobium rosa]|uniref:sugar phosphate isomerase/epimerase family protein n=1 Tax=Novosphingobium rosa TaxID=76978 RepID=UPI00082D9BE0|nr:sugar phosphate isomerase/epimerase [Novosphingobium rosa]